MSEALGVLGGSFNPVHLGHLVLAQAVRHALALPRVLLVPAALPPHKSSGDLAPAAERAKMVALAVERWEGLELSTVELDHGTVRYTIDTLRQLAAGPPPCLPVFVLGADSLLDLTSWRSHAELVEQFDLAVVDRPGMELASAKDRLEPALVERIVALARTHPDTQFGRDLQPGRGGRIFHVPLTPISISASDVRSRAARGDSLVGLVPPAVAGYIRATGLYRQEARP